MRTARSLPGGGAFSVQGGLCQGDSRGQTDTCKIITLLQTSFAGGNVPIM